MNDIISKIQSLGFEVNERGHVYKYSQNTRRKEIAGQLNKGGVYFYAQNVNPFKQGQNTFKDIFGETKQYIPFIAPVESTHDFSFQDYINTTKRKNQLSIFIDKYTNENPYDIRGVKGGYLDDATLFPYINYDNQFITAKIVKYNTNTGKRIKSSFSNSWFHAYKPIKKELGLTDKISKKINCFFGEHLLNGNNKPVVIVEAEKTAILLSLLYEDIVFIASGGLGKLKTLDYSFLINRSVYVFPDNNALEWFKIAKKRGWWCSEVLENKGVKGADAADYFDTEIGEELAKELDSISFNEISLNTDDLNFSLKEKQTKKYCIPNLYELGLTVYYDNAKGNYFSGKNFGIYDNDFTVLNANIDFNKYQLVKGKFIPVDAKEFINRLEKCFRIMKYLNPDVNHKKEFRQVLLHLLENSNYLFSLGFIENELLDIWDTDANDITEYYKSRNWRFNSNNHIEEKEFLILLNNDKKAKSTNKYLLKLQPLLQKREYINAAGIGLTKQKNEFIWDLVKTYNNDVLGCNTINNYKQKLELNKYFDFVEETTAILSDNEKPLQKFCNTYYKSNIECKENVTTFKIPSIQTIFDNTLVAKRIIREYFDFTPDESIYTDIKITVDYLLSNPLELEFKRIDKRIAIDCIKTVEYMDAALNDNPDATNIDLNDAFNYKLDLTGAILNCSEEEAIQRNNQFLYSWICFHNKDLTEHERELIYYNPMGFVDNTYSKVA
jgi:hypothetical protein